MNDKFVEIIRIVELVGNPWFKVSTELGCISCHSYKADDPEDEERALKAAQAIATKIEAGQTRVEEVIYTTKKENN